MLVRPELVGGMVCGETALLALGNSKQSSFGKSAHYFFVGRHLTA